MESEGSSSRSNDKLEFRSFWKAGGYDAGFTVNGEQGELEHARVHPKFLHSNATSHKWAFGAIAELLDNAVDEICNGATFVKLDKISNLRDHTPALLFQDNGGGMDPGSMRQCMSLGYSKKKENTIGQYGNGFKTSTMRLGSDVIVFSRTTCGSRTTESIGLLSYTFLRRTGQDDVIVPMVDFEHIGDRKQPIVCTSLDDWSSNLGIILEWSPFAIEHELMQQFEDIGPHGTKIIVYNLWQNDDGLLELDFDHDEEDIRLRDDINREKSLRKKEKLNESHISYHIRFSLRAYASILYLRKLKDFDIILRGKAVQQYNIVDDLKYTEVVMYRPQLGKASKEVSVKTEIGYVKEAPLLQVSGFNVYHKNRLIRPFWRVIHDHTSTGNGVVGILEANFIEPAHDKQDFERSSLYLKLETRLKQMLHDYWKSHCHLIGNHKYTQLSNDKAAKLQEVSEQPVIDRSANMQHEMHIEQHVIGVAANMQTVAGHTSNMQMALSSAQPIIGLSADGLIQANTRTVWSPIEANGHRASSKDSTASVDKICEENLQLFLRCEEHRKKQTELKQMIEKMEKELAETKRKCSCISSHLKNQKKLRSHTGKA